MPHPYTNDTLIKLDIQADNKVEIVQCVIDTVPYMEGWTINSSVHNALANHSDSRFYAFNLSLKSFDWWRMNNTFSDTLDEDETPIRDMAQISELLEFVYLHAEELRKKPDAAWLAQHTDVAPAKGGSWVNMFKPSGNAADMAAILEYQAKLHDKMAEEVQKEIDEQILAKMEKIAMTGYPKGKVWYLDSVHGMTTSYGGKSMLYEPTVKIKMTMQKAKDDLSQHHYYEYCKSVEWANTEGELIGINNKLCGLHGPYATQLKQLIETKLKGIQKAKELEAWKIAQEQKQKKNNELGSWKAFVQAAKTKKVPTTSTPEQKQTYGTMWDDPYKDAVIKFKKQPAPSIYYKMPKKQWASETQGYWYESNDPYKYYYSEYQKADKETMPPMDF